MATPLAAGAAILVRQYFMDGWYPTHAKTASNTFSPSAPLVKAVMMGAPTMMMMMLTTAFSIPTQYITAMSSQPSEGSPEKKARDGREGRKEGGRESPHHVF
jgi:hypothetical protein